MEQLVVFMVFGMIGWIIGRAIHGKTKDTNQVSSATNEKSKRMLEKGKVCPPHNWGNKVFKIIINGHEHKTEKLFCDICKKTPSQLNDS